MWSSMSFLFKVFCAGSQSLKISVWILGIHIGFSSYKCRPIFISLIDCYTGLWKLMAWNTWISTYSNGVKVHNCMLNAVLRAN